MTKEIHAIYEDGVLKPLDKLEFKNQQMVQLTLSTIESDENGDMPTSADPLDGIRMKTGISDLSTSFDDYRFGRKQT
jgi:hypothetical protein